ncbi:MAG: hypothetical protein ACXWB2_00550 [Acidimicrobiales bacterium]
MTIDQLAIDQLAIDQLAGDRLAGDVTSARAVDAAVPDPTPGSGTAAAPRVRSPRSVPATGAQIVPIAGSDPWARSRRWTDARVVPMGPPAVAVAWCTALARGDWTTAWWTTDPNLRLALAQQWLDGLGRTGDNVTAWALAAEVAHIGMWAPFADQLFARWSPTGGDRYAPGFSDRHQFERLGRADVGRELGVVHVGGDGPAPELTLRLRDRWRIAGVGRGVMQPGWPARWIDLSLTSTMTSTSTSTSPAAATSGGPTRGSGR